MKKSDSRIIIRNSNVVIDLYYYTDSSHYAGNLNDIKPYAEILMNKL